MNYAKLFDKVYESLYKYRRKVDKKKEIKAKEWVERYSKYPITDAQKEEIEKYYEENYGKKIDLGWHLLYACYTGKMDKTYFPSGIYMSELEPALNSLRYRRVMEDKNLIPLLAAGIEGLKCPISLGSCSNGVYKDKDGKVVTKEKLVEALSNAGKIIAKPTIGTSSGQYVNLFDFENGIDKASGKSVSELVDFYGRNFVIQERIKNHKCIADLHKESINTFRTITYIWNGAVHSCPLVMRLGRGDNFLDNAHAGGMYVGVNDNGDLCPQGFDEDAKDFLEHPDSHVKFEGYNIPFVPEILRCAKELHSRIPQLGMISWDMTVDENGTVVVIEANIEGQSIAMPQMATGRSLFGENTTGILNYLRDIKK